MRAALPKPARVHEADCAPLGGHANGIARTGERKAVHGRLY